MGWPKTGQDLSWAEKFAKSQIKDTKFDMLQNSNHEEFGDEPKGKVVVQNLPYNFGFGKFLQNSLQVGDLTGFLWLGN